jgi:hypothetical protein
MKTRTPGGLLARPLLGLVWIYRRAVSPFLGVNCRFVPSCSDYAAQALKEYGAFAGGWLALKRVCRCHPWGGSGYDPLPERCAHRPDHREDL